MVVVMSGYVIANIPCPPKPRKGYTMYFDKFVNKWIFVKKYI